jgi:hypothetical protein
MTVLVSYANPMVDLPLAIKREREALKRIEAAYAETKSASGFTKFDIGHQQGKIAGMLDALSYVMQGDWCSKNDHPVPMVTADDVWRYVEWIAGKV